MNDKIKRTNLTKIEKSIEDFNDLIDEVITMFKNNPTMTKDLMIDEMARIIDSSQTNFKTTQILEALKKRVEFTSPEPGKITIKFLDDHNSYSDELRAELDRIFKLIFDFRVEVTSGESDEKRIDHSIGLSSLIESVVQTNRGKLAFVPDELKLPSKFTNASATGLIHDLLFEKLEVTKLADGEFHLKYRFED